MKVKTSVKACVKAVKATVFAAMLTAAVVLSSCSVGEKTLLKKAAESAAPASTVYTQQNYQDIYASSEAFAAKFAQATYANYSDESNFAVSPLSVYMALALVSQCAAAQTKEEILTTLDLSDELLTSSFSDFYGSLVSERTDDNGKLISALKLSNSVWVANSVEPKQNCMDTLADSYHCSSYRTDFLSNNASANQAIQDFVKQETNGLIDKNFALTPDTLFALINTLYLKDVWTTGGGLAETKDKYTFTNYNNQTAQKNLLQGNYVRGQAYEEEQFSSFYTATENGYKLKFILPKDGYSVDDVFTQETIAKVNAITDYNGVDEENKVHYNTRCLFPSFKADYDEDITDVLSSNFALNTLFDPIKCNLTDFADPPAGYDNICCSKVRHVTDLTVDKEGIEGSAVTVFDMVGTSSMPQPYKEVYRDFIVNKSFGFVITNPRNVTLFSGVIKSV